MTIQQTLSHSADGAEALIGELIARARIAQSAFEADADQERYDMAAKAIGWALLEESRNRALSEMAVATTGLGNVTDKITKNHRKTLGLLRDISGEKTQGVISNDDSTGLTEIARPKGVVAAIVPSTNPVATPTNNTINALKCGNAIILAPSPKGVDVCEILVGHMHTELARLNLPVDLVQVVPAPASKAKTQALMEMADLLVVTGSQDNVRRAYSSGTPAIGVGAGNATVIVDETADIVDAAAKITASKTFDNATSCSSENAVVVVDAVRDAFLAELHRAGGRLLDETNAVTLKQALFQNGHLNRHIIAQDISTVLAQTGIVVAEPDRARFLILSATGIGPDHPESGEKLSLVLALYVASDYKAAAATASQILDHQGAGHSIGIHTKIDARAQELGMKVPVCRVIVNQAHTFATGGSFDNGLPFSLSMGCGSWGGNSIDENLNFRHFMNTTQVVRSVAANEPSVDDIFSEYWKATGQ